MEMERIKIRNLVISSPLWAILCQEQAYKLVVGVS